MQQTQCVLLVCVLVVIVILALVCNAVFDIQSALHDQQSLCDSDTERSIAVWATCVHRPIHDGP